MPFVWKGLLIKSPWDPPITKMSMRELIDYEEHLWKWMQNSPPHIVSVLNSIHREVEWRAGKKDWDNAAPAKRGL